MPTAIRDESSPETETRTRHELSPQTRARICKLRSYNLSYREIYAVFPEIPLSTIRSTILKEPAREGHKSLPRAGRPRTLTPEQRDHVYDLLAHREPNIKMRDLLAEVDHAIKPRAMRLLLREMGFPRLLATKD
ncbi:uncharacterized protein DNG_01519 [Cephalotrichum gorgonifer]|uniref:Uncharacterized protein n=1 Tax=Cephalotrichum gorgonifer TaxID=2041049 RepID=A0AAE8MR35_9PEZI|nr:uncharacterized protein DNG_01519 [Cephalotrichum gorgonifer]